MTNLTLLFVVCGVSVAVAGIPLSLRRIPPNRLYGLRIPSTLQDEHVWYEANAKTGRDLIVVGALQVVLALLLGWLPGLDEDGYALLNAVIFGSLVLTSTAVGWRRARAMSAARHLRRR
jgi:uncharacterized membrane protein